MVPALRHRAVVGQRAQDLGAAVDRQLAAFDTSTLPGAFRRSSATRR